MAEAVLSSARTAHIILAIVCVLAFVMIADVAYAATHHRVETRIDNCALILDRSGQQRCR